MFIKFQLLLKYLWLYLFELNINAAKRRQRREEWVGPDFQAKIPKGVLVICQRWTLATTKVVIYPLNNERSFRTVSMDFYMDFYDAAS